MFKKNKLVISLILSLSISIIWGTNCVLAETIDNEELAIRETSLNKETTIEITQTPVEFNNEIIEKDSNDTNNSNSKTYEANSNSVQPSNLEWSHLLSGLGKNTLYINNIQATKDGGYIIATNTQGLIWLTKIDINGNIKWSYTYGQGNEWHVGAVEQTEDGSYVLTGRVNEDVFLIKMTPTGSFEWLKLFGGDKFDAGSDVVQTTDGGYFIVGSSKSFGSSYDRAYIIKTDANGDGEWGGILPREENEGFEWGHQALIEPSTGNIIVSTTLSVLNFNNIQDKYRTNLLKINNNGTIITSKSYNLKYDETNMVLTSDGGIAINCSTYDDDNYYILLYKFDSSFNMKWDKIYQLNGYYSYFSKSVDQTNDGGYIISGIGHTTDQDDVLLIKVNSSGNTEWINTFSIGEGGQPLFVKQTEDDGYVIAGVTGKSSEENIYILKLK